MFNTRYESQDIYSALHDNMIFRFTEDGDTIRQTHRKLIYISSLIGFSIVLDRKVWFIDNNGIDENGGAYLAECIMYIIVIQ